MKIRNLPSNNKPRRKPAQPKKRKSLFACQIWSVEHKPSFARSSIYGYAR